jgi:hypothetical protein
VASLTEGPETHTAAGEARQSDGPSLKLVFGVLTIITLVVGILGYRRYANSERWVAEGIAEMDRIGAQLEPEGCIDAAVHWYDACDQHQANAAVCLQGVSILMFHCLGARDREPTCELYLDPNSAVHQPTEGMRERARNAETAGESGRWVYARCEERGMNCINKRECACAEAYRAIDSFCRTGQQAVQL